MNSRKSRSNLAVVTVLGLLIALLPATAASAAGGLAETFDDNAGFTTSSEFFSDGGWDYFGITDGVVGDFGAGSLPTGLKPYTGFTGSFLAGMDLDAEGASLPFVVEWSGIDIGGMTAPEFSGDFCRVLRYTGGHRCA